MYPCRSKWFDSQLAKPGLLATLRLLFAKIRVIECNRDFSPTHQTVLILKVRRETQGNVA